MQTGRCYIDMQPSSLVQWRIKDVKPVLWFTRADRGRVSENLEALQTSAVGKIDRRWRIAG
jgi:hypothetical protein